MQFGDVIPIQQIAVVGGQVGLVAGQAVDGAKLAAPGGRARQLFCFWIYHQHRAGPGEQGICQVQPLATPRRTRH